MSLAEVSTEALVLAQERMEWAASPVALARSVALIQPDPWQVDLLTTVAQRVLVCCSRQVGKSTIAGLLALHTALFQPGSLTLMVASSFRQSRELFRKTKTCWEQLLQWGRARGLGYLGPELEEDNATSLGFGNGSRIVALPANATTVRGFSAVKLYIEDEAAFVPDDLYESVSPALAVSNGREILLSSPFGKRGHFYKAWTEDKTSKRLTVKATECPRIPAAFLRQALERIGPWAYEQEYMCEFKDTDDQFFGTDLVRAAIDAGIVAGVQPLFPAEAIPSVGGAARLFGDSE